jgi:hypothetical protein
MWRLSQLIGTFQQCRLRTPSYARREGPHLADCLAAGLVACSIIILSFTATQGLGVLYSGFGIPPGMVTASDDQTESVCGC